MASSVRSPASELSVPSPMSSVLSPAYTPFSDIGLVSIVNLIRFSCKKSLALTKVRNLSLYVRSSKCGFGVDRREGTFR